MLDLVQLTNLISILFTTAGATTSSATVNWTNVILVILMAVGVNLLYAVGRLKLTDVDKMRRYTLEMRAFQSEMRQAMREGDKQKQDKLKKKQQQMTKMQMEMQKQQLKPTFLFMIPLFGLYYLVNGWMNCGALTFFCSKSIPLMVVPIYVPYIFATPLVPFWVWYFVCSFTFSTLINRIFGLTFDY